MEGKRIGQGESEGRLNWRGRLKMAMVEWREQVRQKAIQKLHQTQLTPFKVYLALQMISGGYLSSQGK